MPLAPGEELQEGGPLVPLNNGVHGIDGARGDLLRVVRLLQLPAKHVKIQVRAQARQGGAGGQRLGQTRADQLRKLVRRRPQARPGSA